MDLGDTATLCYTAYNYGVLRESMNIYRMRRNYRELDDIAISGRLSSRRHLKVEEHTPGFTLIELLIAMAVGMIILTAVYSVFTQQSKQFANQEVVVEMQQNARMAMDIITRDIRLAGYAPPNPSITLARCSGSLTASSTTCVGIRNASANYVSFAADLDGDGSLTMDNTNPHENIVYYRYFSTASNAYVLGRTSNGQTQPVIDNLDFLGFSYFDGIGGTPTDLANIRMVRITIRVIAAKKDPSYPTNGGFRTYTLVSDVKPRNLGL